MGYHFEFLTMSALRPNAANAAKCSKTLIEKMSKTQKTNHSSSFSLSDFLLSAFLLLNSFFLKDFLALPGPGVLRTVTAFPFPLTFFWALIPAKVFSRVTTARTRFILLKNKYTK